MPPCHQSWWIKLANIKCILSDELVRASLKKEYILSGWVTRMTAQRMVRMPLRLQTWRIPRSRSMLLYKRSVQLEKISAHVFSSIPAFFVENRNKQVERISEFLLIVISGLSGGPVYIWPVWPPPRLLQAVLLWTSFWSLHCRAFGTFGIFNLFDNKIYILHCLSS